MTTPAKAFPKCGVSYVGQLEHEYMLTHKLGVCANCMAVGWNKELKRCNGCQLVDYCSRECQKSKWSKHKPFCNMVQGRGLRKDYLASFSQKEVFRRLIDSYRLRVEIDHIHREEDHGIYYPGKWEEGIVWVKGDVEDDFQRYLDLVEDSELLPEWWRFEHRMECLAIAIDTGNDENIFTQIKQNDLIPNYDRDMEIRTALLIFSELAVGYEGKGARKDDEWYKDFVKYLNETPEEKAKLIKGSVEAVAAAFRKHGQEMPPI